MLTSVDDMLREVSVSWTPPKRTRLSEWADQYFALSAESSAQEGRWRTLPYQKGIMDAMTDPSIEMVSVKKSARVGYTKCLNALIAYHIHQDPCSILLVQPTESDADGYSKEEIAPMLRDVPVLRGLVADAKSRDSGNTILAKQYPGGVLSMVGANSPRGFRRISRRVVLLDEVDAYPISAGSEGDQIKLAIKRAEYFWNRKIVAGSTPTEAETSRIDRLFKSGDQRMYFVPCPHCDGLQYLKWGAKDPWGIKWPSGQPEKAVYVCEHCGESIQHAQKYDMIQAGEWQPTAEAKQAGHASFHIWAAYSYSPNATWGQLASEWVEAHGNPELLKTFVNTALGECWEEEYSARLDSDGLARRAEPYELLTVPDPAVVITAGVDVQDNRVHIVQRAWGPGEESWLVNRAEIFGDPGGYELWDQVLSVLSMKFRHASGALLQTTAACVDSGGHYTHEVYAFCRQHRGRNIIATQGRPGPKPVLGKPTKQDINLRGQTIQRGATLYGIGVDTIKNTIYGRLKRGPKEGEPFRGPGVYHWPMGLPPEYWQQLTAEKKQARYVKGFAQHFWVKKPGDRNEDWDCEVMAYAALEFAYTRSNRATFWQQASARLERAHELAGAAPPDIDTETGEILKPPPVIAAASGPTVSLKGWRRGV